MKNKKITNKQILDAYGQSYRLMQEDKRYDDIQNKKDSHCKKHGVVFEIINSVDEVIK